ncbi:glycosyltransferase family 2 protein [Klebsiella michiganensis]|uniref:glycosyltransferase family 2 protein n=1 Tax=Klebsiella TaxID=570 RepID=UPI0022476740|nr:MULTISPECIES: glycosyltransferase family 2 protein [Klebsiella]MCW9486834.1 glycosyltransferase family 2 protein [Klebsiella michiganensis]MDU3356075.1 glycosyltransferase family 2 protein [Klebsiella sp.]HCU0764685.1 glycosyltransferase family 2 protein [Klebsiella michiganensis]HDX8627354.1 glycosyltransferase family 2 protein [Klebsiella michiganensis]HEP0437333.1 glycosyltransferase family 2 protein [Klebsiella michiganensis]
MISNFSVTVVIPTIGRESIYLSIDSVLSQTYKVTNIIICYDGNDFEDFILELSSYYSDLIDKKIIIILNVGPFSGGNVARQRGIEVSNSRFIALLDDDDIWERQHIEDLFSFITPDTENVLLSSCATIIEEGKKDLSVPPRMINNNESIPDYLFRVNGIKLDCGFIQSSLMIFTRELAIKVPFDISLKYHQDIDWLLRLSNSKIKFSYIQSPNHTVRYMSTPFSVSKKISSKDSISWAKRSFKDSRLLGDFVLTQSYNYAKSNGSILDEINVLWWSLYNAKPSFYAVTRFFLKFFRIDSILRKFAR